MDLKRSADRLAQNSTHGVNAEGSRRINARAIREKKTQGRSCESPASPPFSGSTTSSFLQKAIPSFQSRYKSAAGRSYVVVMSVRGNIALVSFHYQSYFTYGYGVRLGKNADQVQSLCL